MSEKIHRVIVAVSDGVHKLESSRKDKALHNDINILDKTTLLLHMNSVPSENSRLSQYYQQMQFDAVGYDDDDHIRNDLSLLFRQMFENQQNGCLIRLAPWRTHNVRLLNRLLVTDLEKYIQQMPDRLERIYVEYHDVRKFEMINMLMPILKSMRAKSKPRQRELYNTTHLFKWLHNEYTLLRGRGLGDDYINLEFVLTTPEQKQVKLSLAIFNIFDCVGRNDIANFFQKLPTGKMKQSTLITDCIRESFDCKQPVFTVVLCEVPLNRGSSKEMHKFLQLADTAYMSIAAANSKIDLKVKPLDSLLSLTNKCKMSASDTYTPSNISLRCQTGNLSAEDYSKLASWYHRIDKKFNEVKECMACHYDVQYRQKYIQICRKLHSQRVLTDKSGGDANGMYVKNSANDLLLTAKYMEALRKFRQLEKDVNNCCFVSTLSTYMNTKNFELQNIEKELKQQEAKNLEDQRKRLQVSFY